MRNTLYLEYVRYCTEIVSAPCVFFTLVSCESYGLVSCLSSYVHMLMYCGFSSDVLASVSCMN
jgi:hypothetical protein